LAEFIDTGHSAKHALTNCTLYII